MTAAHTPALAPCECGRHNIRTAYGYDRCSACRQGRTGTRPIGASASHATTYTPTPWVERAACGGHQHLFFHPEHERGAHTVARHAAAFELCDACPVAASCRDYADSLDETDGIWAGRCRTCERLQGKRRPKATDA